MASELRRWLQKHPQPARVRAIDAEGEERLIKIGVARSKWRDAESATEGACKLEALDTDGEVLRVCDLGEPSSSSSSSSKPVAGVLDLVQLAKLLNEAADNAAARHEAAYRMAFDQNSLLVRALTERLLGLEKAWHRLLMSQEQTAGGEDGMVTQLLGSALQAEMAQRMNGSGSGKKGDNV